MNFQPKNKFGRVMLRAAALQFMSYHYGKGWYPDPELAEDPDDAIRHAIDEVEILKKQQHSAPKLSDEYMED